MENRYHGAWTVPLSHCDDTARLSVQGALSQFMDIAALHAEQIGVGGEAMAQRGLFWLTVRSRIRLYARPAMMQTVTLETWPGAVENLRCERFYTMKHGQTLLAEARTQWAVLDLASKRPVPVAAVYPPELILPEETVCDGAYAPLRGVPEDEICRYTVRSVDLDLGCHMNNVAYVWMLLGTFPSAELHRIREMETHYRRPCFEGETLSIRRRRTEDGWQLAAVKESGETAVAALLRTAEDAAAGAAENP